MHESHEFLKALAIVLCVAAATTVLFQRLRQPVVLGYLLAGIIIGPHLPLPLVADPGIVQTLSELGVILLMFSLGLEFSLGKLFKVGPTAGLTAVVQCSLMLWVGFIVGRSFGWTTRESIFTGALIAISSTTIIAKAFEEQGVVGKLKEIVVGVLIVEDLIAILLMAALTAIATGAGLSAGALALTVGRLGAFLVGLVVVGLFIIPRAMRSIVKLKRPETTLVASVGICFAMALLAQEAGYSVALGAFLAGSLIAESGEEKEVEHLVQPVRDMFAAIFFVSVGMLIDPKLVAEHWLAVGVLTVVVIVGKILSVALGAFLTGNGTRTSVQAGMSLAQIGEFSFIIAGLGLSLGATRSFLYPVAVAVSAITTLTTPWLIRAAGPVANLVDAKLPKPLQTFASLYGSWVENLGSSRGRASVSVNAKLRRRGLLLLGDVVLLLGVVIVTAVFVDRFAAAARARVGVSPAMARLAVWTLGAGLAAPFLFGIARLSRGIGVLLADSAFPASSKGRVDLAAAPRRVLVVTLQLAILLVVGIPILAVTQPFLRGVQGAFIFLVLVGMAGLAFWRSATSLDGHVRAGAQAIVEALAAQTGPRSASSASHPPAVDSLELVRRMLPGLGEPVPVELGSSSPAVGKTLADLNLRGQTGATVLAIRRGSEGVLVPSADQALQGGDVLALAGSHEAIDAARAVLQGEAAAVPVFTVPG